MSPSILGWYSTYAWLDDVVCILEDARISCDHGRPTQSFLFPEIFRMFVFLVLPLCSLTHWPLTDITLLQSTQSSTKRYTRDKSEVQLLG